MSRPDAFSIEVFDKVVEQLPAHMSGHDLVALFSGLILMYGVDAELTGAICESTYFTIVDQEEPKGTLH